MIKSRVACQSVMWVIYEWCDEIILNNFIQKLFYVDVSSIFFLVTWVKRVWINNMKWKYETIAQWQVDPRNFDINPYTPFSYGNGNTLLLIGDKIKCFYLIL